MIKRAMPQIENVWLVNTKKGFDKNVFDNIIISVNKDGYTFLVKETDETNKVHLVDFNYPEPVIHTVTIDDLFKYSEIYMCDNLKEVVQIIEENGWKLWEKEKSMRILIWLMMVGCCVGSLCYRYQQEINGIYDQQIQFEIVQKELSEMNNSF